MSFASLDVHDGGYLLANDCAAYQFGTGDFTVEAWVRTFTGGTVVGKKDTDGGPGNGGFLFVVRPDGTMKLATDNGFGFYEFDSAATSVCDGVWHHVAAVRQGTTIAIYLDGAALDGNPRGTINPPLNVNNNSRLTIGTVDQQQESYRNFAGSLAEVRLWSRARAAQEIIAARGFRLAPDTADLVGYWSAEMGLMLDFSSTRSATQVQGSVTPSANAPAVGAGNAPPMLFLFSGSYEAAVKQGGIYGTWTPTRALYVTSMGHVVQNDQVLTGVEINGNAVTWPAEGNPTSGTITFNLSSTDTYYWPDGPQTCYDYQGRCQVPGEGKVDYRGVILPTCADCGMVLNVGTGQVLFVPDAQAGSPVTLSVKTAQVDEQYCVYDNHQILQMRSGLAISVHGDPAAGAAIVLSPPSAGSAGQSWTFGSDGLVRLLGTSSLALAVDSTPTPARLVLATADSVDSAQQFVTLAGSQFVWSGHQPYVLATTGDYTQVTTVAKANDAPAELWYVVRSSLINSTNGMALAVVGTAVPGATLAMARLNPADTAQAFEFDTGQLRHLATGLAVKMAAPGGAVVLGAAGETGANLTWNLAPVQDPEMMTAVVSSSARAGARADVPAVNYVIRVYTGDSIAAGTDDKVEVALQGTQLCSNFVELKNSETHTDPFERGCMDQFTVSLPNVGKILGIHVRYGADNWFWNDRWVVDYITVYDPTIVATYTSGLLGNGSQYQMPSQTRILLPESRTGGSSSTMSVGKAPTQDTVTRGWVDHTWNKVYDTKLATFFDCGGGHEGPGTTNDIVTSRCSLSTAVKMATGCYIDPQHPYQPVYGNNDVRGTQTCGIRASGFRAWDGQCHQMTNRLLYICNPMVSLDDAPPDKKPTGYGLTVLMFGRYGVEFGDWCRLNGFAPPPASASSLFDYVRRYISREDQAIKVAYHAITMQDAIAGDPQNAHGPAAHVFFRAVKDDGITNSTMSGLVCLPEQKVMEEQQPDMDRESQLVTVA